MHTPEVGPVDHSLITEVPPPMSLYRHRADIPASLLVLAVFCVQMWAFVAIHDPMHLAALVALLMVVQVSCGAVCHNHHHVNLFTRPVLNRAIEVVMYLQTGTSPLSWTLHHNIGHHGDYLDQEKDPSRWQETDGRTMSRLKYDLLNAFLIYPEIWTIGRRHPVLFARFRRWLWISNAVLLALVIVNPVSTLIVFVVPMALMLIVLLDNTYQQHSGLSTAHHYLASRNVEHPLYNLTSWNLGFHTAHHMYPGIHWSHLPALHARIRAKIPPALISQDLLPRLDHEIPREVPGDAVTD
ncbi:MAG TPA: fatty acid desaturase [Moraxellaceae bacterium]|nr:fatty acid desaturase [Moraxellaceae bacterium]